MSRGWMAGWLDGWGGRAKAQYDWQVGNVPSRGCKDCERGTLVDVARRLKCASIVRIPAKAASRRMVR